MIKHTLNSTLLLLCLVVCSLDALAQDAPRAGRLVVEPYTLQTYDGRSHAAELGRLWVRENRASRSGRLIRLAPRLGKARRKGRATTASRGKLSTRDGLIPDRRLLRGRSGAI